MSVNRSMVWSNHLRNYYYDINIQTKFGFYDEQNNFSSWKKDFFSPCDKFEHICALGMALICCTAFHTTRQLHSKEYYSAIHVDHDTTSVIKLRKADTLDHCDMGDLPNHIKQHFYVNTAHSWHTRQRWQPWFTLHSFFVNTVHTQACN